MSRAFIILISLILTSIVTSTWYTNDDYKNLKRSVSWTPYKPEEHPLKSLTIEQVNTLIMGHRTKPQEPLPKYEPFDDQDFHIPSFLLGVPTEYYTDQAFPACVQEPFSYSNCPRSDIWALTRTLQWSDCARKIRNITYSGNNFLECDKNFVSSCAIASSFLNLNPYSDEKRSNVGFVSDKCNPNDGIISGTVTCLKPCRFSCEDGSMYKPVKISPAKTVLKINDVYSLLSSGNGVIITFSANSDILSYKGGVYIASGDLTFHGRVVGYMTYMDIREKNAIVVEMGFGKNWGENGKIRISNSGRRTMYNLSSK